MPSFGPRHVPSRPDNSRHSISLTTPRRGLAGWGRQTPITPRGPAAGRTRPRAAALRCARPRLEAGRSGRTGDGAPRPRRRFCSPAAQRERSQAPWSGAGGSRPPCCAAQAECALLRRRAGRRGAGRREQRSDPMIRSSSLSCLPRFLSPRLSVPHGIPATDG